MKKNTAIDLADYLIPTNAQLDLQQHATHIDPLYQSKDDYKKQLKSSTKQLQKWQELLYADNRYSLLIIFQAMDAAGKDGANLDEASRQKLWLLPIILPFEHQRRAGSNA